MPSRSSRRQRGYPTASEIRESRQRAAEMMIPCMEPDRVDSLLTRLTPLRGEALLLFVVVLDHRVQFLI